MTNGDKRFKIAVAICITLSLVIVVLLKHPDVLARPDCVSEYKLINAYPDCEAYEKVVPIITSLQDKLDSEVAVILREGKALRISVFSRDLFTRRFVGVNENETYVMASLLKLPLAVIYYKVAEVTPEVLEESVKYDGAIDLYREQRIQPLEKLTVGSTYTIRELIRRALIYSDNTAAEVLNRRLHNGALLEKVLVALGIRFSKPDSSKEDLITARTYAGVFRILYNASYLTREYSNELLDLMTGSYELPFSRSKIPARVLISHKYGERSVYDDETGVLQYRQLHDCGIVYPDNGQPYSFCILTEGKDYVVLEEVIGKLEGILYEGLSRNE